MLTTYQSDAPGQRYRIQTDEETGGDDVWGALHYYAEVHPAPAALAPFVDRDVLGDFNGVVVDKAAGEAALAWLAAAAKALKWDDRTTPVLVTPEDDDDDERVDLMAHADRIATDHGCQIMRSEGLMCIGVLPFFSQGDPRDRGRIAKCRAALIAAGIRAEGWLS